MKKVYLTVLPFLVLFILVSFRSLYGTIYYWDLFERNSLTPWTEQIQGSGVVTLEGEPDNLIYSAHQRHGEKSIKVRDGDDTSYASASCPFPSLADQEREFMVEFYFYIPSATSSGNWDLLRDLFLYKPSRNNGPANISIVLVQPFDSSNGKKYWRLRIEDGQGAHSISYPESLSFWHRFQIHQLESGVVNLWINGDSIGSFISSSSTLPPDKITIGTLEGMQNGTAFWDDFIITTPPQNAKHPRVYFDSLFIPELRNRRTNADSTPIGVSYKTLWDRRRKWLDSLAADIPDQNGYFLNYPYYEPPGKRTTHPPDTLVKWDFIAMRWERRMELAAFVLKIDSENSPGLFDTLRPCLRAITKWQRWVNPIDTPFNNLPFPPFEYCGHSTAFITRGVAVVYDLIYDRLSNYERMSIQNIILTHGIGQIYLGLKKGIYYREGWYWTNWGCLYASALGIACLSLDDSVTIPQYWNFVRNEFLTKLLSPTDQGGTFDPLGTSDEGLSYGTFSVQSLARLAEAMKNVLGDHSLYAEPYLREYINGFIHLLVSGWNNMVMFGDVQLGYGVRGIPADAFYILTKYYQSELGQWLLGKLVQYDELQGNDRIWGWPISYLPHFICLDATLQVKEPKEVLNLTRYFNQIGWISSRTDWSDNGLVVAFKSGPCYTGHGYHQDNNNFVIGKKGWWLVTDRGYRTGDISHYHNVLTVDNQGQASQPPRDGRITAFDTSCADAQFIFLKGDAYNSYSYNYYGNPLLRWWLRSGVLVKKPVQCFILYDDIKSDVPRNLDWRLRPEYRTAYYGGDSILMPGRLLVKFLLPDTPRIEWDIDTIPRPHYSTEAFLENYGCLLDTIESDGDAHSVFNVAPNRSDTSVYRAQYLTVFLPLRGTTRPPIVRIDGSTMVGALVKNSAVMFSKLGPGLPVDEVQFQLEASQAETADIFLVDLLPNSSYTLFVFNEDDSLISSNVYPTTSEGCLYFRALIDGRNTILISSKEFCDSKGTHPNQGRHLTRAVNTSDLQWVYQEYGTICRQTMGDRLILPPEYIITRGKNPSIAKAPAALSWICYTTSDSQNCVLERCDGTWKKVNIFSSSTSEIGAPSLVLSQIREMDAPPPHQLIGEMGYVVYTINRLTGPGNFNYLYFSAFDSENVYYSVVLDSGDVVTPSIAITPGDYLHIAWCKDNRVYYQTTLQPITPNQVRQGQQPVWSAKVPVSTPTTPITEPASNPFIEAQGEWVYVTWRGPNEEGDSTKGEVWQRKGKIQPGTTPDWYRPWNLSRSPLRESNYPTQSTGTAVVWQEQLPNNWEIFANIKDQIVNISNTPKNSFYPHTNLQPAPPYVPLEWRLFTVWTEESIPERLYRIKYGNYFFGRPPEPDPALDVICGEPEPSVYCVKRDGYLATFPADYGNEELIYRLPYLHPDKYYLLSLVSCRDSVCYEAEVVLGDLVLDTISYALSTSETLEVEIPFGIYDSTSVVLMVKKITGTSCAVSNIRLYEYEVIPDDSSDGSQSLASLKFGRTELYPPFPNPALRETTIKYQLTQMGDVSLSLFDISGREVKRLVREKKRAGIYTVRLNSDNLPSGVYFIRLKTVNFTKKLVIAK
ncbi:T9SS type A sorting domain-containing protein [candidate division WOR-3 bacterium]|nr:T9SS type A sorting domain-containing protein [candidate division WOR-3 bacterium]